MKILYKTAFSLIFTLSSIISFAQPWEVLGDTTFGNAYDDYYKHLELINDVPHVIYRDVDQTTLKIKVYKNGNWTAPDDSLIANAWDQFREYETVVDQNDQLNVIYHNPDLEKIVVKKFDGNNWTEVGTPFGFPSNNNYPQIKTLGSDKLVALFSEVDSATFASLGILSLYEFDGTSWSRITQGISDTTVDYCDLAVTSTGDIYVSYQTAEWDLYVEKFDGTNWEVLGGGKTDTSEVTGNQLYLDDNDNLLLVSRNRTSSFNWEFRQWNGTAWEMLPSPNHLYAQNGTVMNTNNHTIDFNPIDKKWYIAFTTNSSSRSYFKRYNGTSWEQAGDSLYADPGHVRYGKMRFNAIGNPFYTSKYSKVMTMDLGLVTDNIANDKNQLSWSIYPNPAEAQLFVNVVDKSTLRIYNQNMQLVLETTVSAYQNVVDLQELTTGMYFAQLVNNGDSKALKFIKK